ncbi:MAG: hypothetical protein AABZ02_09960, partial [Bacteroidota bacterium]
MARKLAIVFVLLLAVVVGGFVAEAQIVSHLIVLNAKPESGGKVFLSWTKPPGDSVSYYSVFRAQVSIPLTFTRIDSTTKNESVDTPSVAGRYAE